MAPPPARESAGDRTPGKRTEERFQEQSGRIVHGAAASIENDETSARMLSGRTTINAAVCTWWAYTQEAPNEILIIANDLEQAQARTFKAIRGFLCYNPALTHSADPQSLRAIETRIKAAQLDLHWRR